jgi:two-component system, OmpR family, copper resistance phosphate regulon response regulator CusR
MKILLVEDEPALAQFVQKGFQSEGYELEIAFDGRVGQTMLRQNTYALAILDVNLPYVNGFELCRIARELHPQMPVMMLTALDSIDDKVTGFDAGADDYLAKPFEFKNCCCGRECWPAVPAKLRRGACCGWLTSNSTSTAKS